MMDRPLVLVGMMGSGKSHVGKILAQHLGLPLYDSDAMIEQDEGKSVARIFTEDGEAKFRELERHKIQELLALGTSVISVGGGAITTPEVLREIKSRAVSVWLDCNIDVLFKRTGRNKGRPLLDCDDPKGRLENLLEKRRHLYAQADITADSSGEDVEEVVRNVQKALYAYYDIA